MNNVIENITKDNIVKLIYDFCYENNISIYEFSKRSGISRSWISRLKNEKDSDITLSTLLQFLNVMHYKLEITKK